MTQPRRIQYRYLSYIQALFICILLVINLVGAAKVSQITIINPFSGNNFASFPIGTGIIFFPISYLIGNVLTEVYGYSPSRKVIWSGFGALIFATIMVQIIVKMPPANNWSHQEAYEEVFNISWRIACASIIAFATGEFINSFVLSKMKMFTQGSFLWSRTIGSTICGEAMDTLIFYPLAFLGNPDFPLILLGQIMLANYIGKVTWEVFATPLTYAIVDWLKKAEKEDFYDYETNYNPFVLENV
ncbi:MAG: queuosine precursor transporter [Candidatus Caenarcaniphilales bacterium]|nr:queuosine precursor transporter [Candidatus Caenarcaniphilales bacterium]